MLLNFPFCVPVTFFQRFFLKFQEMENNKRDSAGDVERGHKRRQEKKVKAKKTFILNPPLFIHLNQSSQNHFSSHLWEMCKVILPCITYVQNIRLYRASIKKGKDVYQVPYSILTYI